MVDARSSRCLLLCGAVLGVAFLGGCQVKPEKAKGKQEKVLVYEDEYVITAEGPWCFWKPGIKKCIERPAGTYRVNSRGKEITGDGRLVEADLTQLRGCESFFDSSQVIEATCSPNFFIQVESDPYSNKQWGLTKRGLHERGDWRHLSTCKLRNNRPVLVAVLDTGVDCTHDDIQCAREYDARTGEVNFGSAKDENGHGTHVAGTACAIRDNGLGVRGAGNCKVLAAKFLGASGGGSLYHAVLAINWAIKNNADIINASFGSSANSSVLEQAIKKAAAKGIITVAAAGNDGRNLNHYPQYPAKINSDFLVTVASHAENGRLSSFSNYGDSVEIIAPGTSILSTIPDNKYTFLSGTSMATPHVSGLLANLLCLYSPKEALERLYQSAEKKLLRKAKYGIAKFPRSLTCQRKKCIRCRKKCIKRFKGLCHRLTRCRSRCRVKTGCKAKCI